MNEKEERPLGREIPFAVDEEPSIRRFRSSILSLRSRRKSLAKNVKMVLADLPVNRDAVKSILPFGLRLDDPPQIRIFIANYERTVYTPSYNEAAAMISVKSLFGRGGHVSWMVVDNDTAMIYGREVFACPKKMARIEYRQEDDKVRAGVSRNGIQIVSVEAERERAEENPGPVFGEKAFNAGGLGQMLALNPVWLIKLEEVFHESCVARGNIVLNDSIYDPIKRLAGQYSNPVTMRIMRLDIVSMRYLFPVGIAGLNWFLKTYNMRFR